MPRVPLSDPVHVADTSHPVLGASLGGYAYVPLSEVGGLTQFGAHLETLDPGAQSSHRHWHEAEDELIYVVAGEVVLIEDAETPLVAGDVAAWAAGSPVGHCVENRSAQPASYLVVGTRNKADVVHYPDAGLSVTLTDRRHRVFRDAAGTVVAQYSRPPEGAL
ncbi:cupin domain-containing protein [Puniceibacterium sediminis]|uniref:Uncharacterized conserved protein, cupin superfamily n=1 Tax=Puniceibacterium sediminis TaxID=1608407 RepID=A0A238XVM4_9RHOB|nr:cupin domain-containing protein [Puniceibacterium sediminis]SNR62740.1 Uncharacterized conserved protein, cupin superfamily [Puniceibacterium sediminis]